MSDLGKLVAQLRDANLRAYTAQPDFIKEHFGIEQTVLAGGYGYRQILELVQNGADAILEAHEDGLPLPDGNRIDVVLRGSYLYVANTGAPLSEEGVRALLSSHSSPKRGNQIGRFGLGFKSLLRLGGKIDLFTKSTGAIRLDPERCRRELQEKFEVPEAPGLRLAWPLEDAERTSDEVLRKFSWAETIVRAEIFGPELVEHLQQEIQAFPAEFLLFLPVAVVLHLDDGTGPGRELKVEAEGEDRVLIVGSEQSRWRLIAKEVSITDSKAKTDARVIHERKSVPLAWAVPLEGKREEAGRFWAFFPTHTPTFVPGILNAPWKLNSDRMSIITGEWNAALMREAAQMIADALPKLCTPDDPGRVLDSFPRQLERVDDDAAPLVQALWKTLENAAVVPDGTGTLRPARELWRHPKDNSEIARQWQALASLEKQALLVHPSCLERQRGSRLNSLAERLKPATGEPQFPNLRKMEVNAWFATVASIEAEKAIQSLKLVESYEKDCTPVAWNPVRPLLAIIPSDDGKLVTPNKAVLAPAGVDVPDRFRVAPALCENAEAKRILLEVLKVRPLDDAMWRSILGDALAKTQGTPIGYYSPNPRSADGEWRAFWKRLRAAPLPVQAQFIKDSPGTIRSRRRDGVWVSSEEILRPGRLVAVDDDGDKNKSVLFDLTEHASDADLLTQLRVTDFPTDTRGPCDWNWIVGESLRLLDPWLRDCRKGYYASVQTSQRPDSSYLKPRLLSMPCGWMLLATLTGAANAKLTTAMLGLLLREEFSKPIRFGHSTTPDRYPKTDVPHPLSWFVLRHGTILIGTSAVRLAAVAIYRNEPAMALVSGWPGLKPAVEELVELEKPGDATPMEAVAFWNAMIALLATPVALANDDLLPLWSGAARAGVVPEKLPSSTGAVTLESVYVSGSPDLAKRARQTSGRIVVTLDDHALKLWRAKGARSLEELLQPACEEIGPPDLLTSAVPELDAVLQAHFRDRARGQAVSGLHLCLDDIAEALPCMMWKDVLLLDTTQLASLPRSERLRHLVNEIAAAGWLAYEPAEALHRLGDAKVDEQRAKVARGASLAERLWLAVGERDEPLRKALGDLAIKTFIQQCAALPLAELTLAQLGPATLSALKDTMAAEGLKPPSRWNTSEARAFVASIGFPAEFAASPESRREAEEFISGPIELPKLHDFQVEVMDGIRALVTSGTARRRAVVSLPTGGGKTRVTVEASVLLVLKPEGDNRSVVWIAQTDELCEQAVQAFRQVWLNLGTEKTDLRIVRLWGGNPNPVIQESEKPVVVVASIQTLNSRMDTEGLAWLQKPGLVVVDECHHAITPSYTNLLRWLDAEAPRPGASAKDEPPIIGLSATPFRMDDEESRRLARRFDERLLPANQAELHSRLRAQGVLSHVDHEALSSQAALLDDELARLGAVTAWDGLDFDRLLEEINQRLGGDEKRNKLLVERVRQAGERSILFFANSKFHAGEMSARLNLEGVPAAAVSGDTPAVARRYFLDRFQRGEIRVLCNHSVLTTGFDAPKTDMVLIARQVFSPVRYMQMVGRGLRGEKNGGTARCRIVTVVDNLGRFQDKHPYHYCQQYFSAGADD